jgi:hypothetical protein
MNTHADSHHGMEETRLHIFLHQTQAESWSEIFITWHRVIRQAQEYERSCIQRIPSRPIGYHHQSMEDNATGCHVLSGHRQLQGHSTCDVDTGTKGCQQEVAIIVLLHHGGKH